MIAGLEEPDSGLGVSMALQSYALFPHFNLRDNITFWLSIRSLSSSLRATITVATLTAAALLLIAFFVFQRQFVQSFMRAGIR